MYQYRSPLLDEEFQRLHEQHERGYYPGGGPPKPLAYPNLPPGRHRPPGFDPYARTTPRPRSGHEVMPSSSSQAARYSSRYKLSSYPQKLNDMFGALECKLCAVEVTSPITAKMHYSGKVHMKNVKKYLTEWSLKTGNPMPMFDQHSSLSSSSSALPDYCELCDVKLLTANDQILHFSGKNHRKNELDPANAKKKGKSYTTIDLSNSTDPRFGIGVDFSTDSKELVALQCTSPGFSCDLCGVKAVSQEQLNIHLGGKKHKDKLKKKESGIPKPVSPSVSILASVTKDQPRGSVDYSMHRTPSERPFKCNECNISLDTKKLLQLHLDGKPHAKVIKKLEQEYKGGSCSLCDVTFNSYMDYKVHIHSKKHDKNCNLIAIKKEFIKDQKDAIACKLCPFIGNLENHMCDRSLEKLKKENKYSNWNCEPCSGMQFDSEEEFIKHKQTRRHLLCMLNVEGEKPDPENIFFYCFTCRKQYKDRKDYTEHLFSHKHLTLSDTHCDLNHQADLWHCDACAIVMDKEAQQEHALSRHHQLMVVQQQMTRTLTDLALQDLGTNTYNCAHCRIDFINFVAFSTHMINPAHLEDIVNSLMDAKAKIKYE